MILLGPLSAFSRRRAGATASIAESPLECRAEMERGLRRRRPRRRPSSKSHTDASVTLFYIEGLNFFLHIDDPYPGVVWDLLKIVVPSYTLEKP